MRKLLRRIRSGRDPGTSSDSLHVGPAALVAFFAASVLAVIAFVDLSPTVDRDLFFSSDDPQLEEDEQIREMFPAPLQIIVSVRSGDGFSGQYITRIGELARDFREIEGIRTTLDILHGPDDLEEAFENPLWQRLLVSEDGESTNVVLLLDGEDFDRIVPAVDEVVEAYQSPDFEIGVSGEPYVVERMRELVVRDFRVFGVGALLVFTLAMLLLYRSGWIVLGTFVAAGTATALTLLVRPLLGLSVDLLTPNITTVVFVLTLLHIVFLTNNWQRTAKDDDRIGTAVRWTLPASFWAMVTTGFGFLSLLLAPAEPARNFGISCAVGTGLAFGSAYLIFPAFLGSADPARKPLSGLDRLSGPFFERLHGKAAVVALVLALIAIPGLLRLNTDPELFEYFQAGSDIREGLERIDRAGGSSPFELVIRDAGGGTLSNQEAFERMWALQQTLEEDRDVGAVLSLPVLMAEAEEQTFWSFLLSWDFLLDRMEDPEHERIASYFVTADRSFGRFVIRMKESTRGEQTRPEVMGRIEAAVEDHGFQVALTGGLYPLQAKMTELVSSSLLTGLLGLTSLFVLIAFAVARSAAVGAAMVVGFSMIPVFLLAVFGYLRLPLDVIALPAANIALAIGVDDLIHLVHHRRRKEGEAEAKGKAGAEAKAEGAATAKAEGAAKPNRGEPEGGRASRDPEAEAWLAARSELLRPILSSSLIVVLGFGLLLLSSFPPTRRLGLAVVIGSVVAAAVVLFVFPPLAVFLRGLRRPSPGSAG